MINIDSIIAYWRNSCSDADRMGIDYRVMKSTMTVPMAEVAQGHVRPELVASLFTSQIAHQSGSVQPEQGRMPQTIDILICPILARRRPERGIVEANVNEAIMPLWVPAVL